MYKEFPMSRRLIVVQSCTAFLGFTASAFAQQRAIFQRADGTLEVHPPAPVEIEGLAPNNGNRESAERAATGRYQVVAVDERAILLNRNTGETWYDADTAEHGRAWLPMKRIDLRDAPGDGSGEADTDSAEAHSHDSHSHERATEAGHEHAEDGHGREPLTETPQGR
jgi:hypothetical protein